MMNRQSRDIYEAVFNVIILRFWMWPLNSWLGTLYVLFVIVSFLKTDPVTWACVPGVTGMREREFHVAGKAVAASSRQISARWLEWGNGQLTEQISGHAKHGRRKKI